MRALKRGSRRGGGTGAGASVASRRRPAVPMRGVPRPTPSATVVLHPDLLRTIAGAVGAAGALETGGPLIGTVQRSWVRQARASSARWTGREPRGTRAGEEPLSLIVCVLATVPPGPALRASSGSVALGRGADGERAASAIRWWRQVTGLDLLHLGDWHKHHSGFPEPSEGDHLTAEKMAADSKAPMWLTAIAVGERAEKEEVAAEQHRARIVRSSGDVEHVRFYRAVTGADLVPVPVHVDAHALPTLPELPWHVTDPARFAAEWRLLHAAGLAPAMAPAANGARPGLTLRLGREGERPLTVVTGPAYPHQPPVVLDGRGRRVARRNRWSAERFLVDLVKEVR